MMADGWQVRALVRREADAGAAAAHGAEPVFGDLTDPESLARFAEGAQVTVNCAGLVKARSRAEFMVVNRDGAAALARSTPGRAVLVSSLAAREPELSDYAASKRAGEVAAREAIGDRLAIVRPPVIYGPGDRETLALFRLARASPFAPAPAAPAARLAMAHVDDMSAAVISLLRRPELSGVYAVGGAQPSGYSWNDIAEAAWRAVGRRPRVLPLSPALFAVAGTVSEVAARLRGRPAIFTRGKARELLHPDWSVGADELTPGAPAAKFDLDRGFADAIAWYRREGWL